MNATINLNTRSFLVAPNNLYSNGANEIDITFTPTWATFCSTPLAALSDIQLAMSPTWVGYERIILMYGFGITVTGLNRLTITLPGNGIAGSTEYGELWVNDSASWILVGKLNFAYGKAIQVF